jgi:hypothetical protein
MISGRQRKAITFTVLGICLVAAAVTLNVSWLVINWREGMMILFGTIFFLVIIAGLIIFTVFLVREIRRNEQHDSFINAVTQAKTPSRHPAVLETLQSRGWRSQARPSSTHHDGGQRSPAAPSTRSSAPAPPDILRQAPGALDSARSRGSVELARTRFHLGPEAQIRRVPARRRSRRRPGLKAAVWNLTTRSVFATR